MKDTSVTWFRENVQQRTRLVYLALMRIAVGYYFVTSSWPKLSDGFASVPLRLWVSPDTAWFGSFVGYAELAIGLSLVTGLLVRACSTLGALHSLNIYLAATNGAVVGLNRLLILLQLAFVLASAGRSLGLDGWLHRKFPRNHLF